MESKETESVDLQIRIWDVQGIRYLREGDYEEAWQLFKKQYELLLQNQEEKGVRLHKGGPLHNGGLSLLYIGKTDEALRWLIFAFVEDLISSEENTDTDLAPASQVLRGVCGASWEDLEPIEKVVLGMKRNGKLIMQPEEIEEIQDSIKSIQTNYREHLKNAWQLEIEGQEGLKEENFERAEDAYQDWLNLLYNYQKIRGVRIHKGYVLFNLGFIFYQHNKIPEAVSCFLEANIEDIISARIPEHVKQTSSFNALNQLGLGQILDVLRSWIIQKKDQGEDVSRPDGLRKNFIEEKKLKLKTPKEAEIETPETTTPKEKSIDDLPGTYSNRVFIGGSYRYLAEKLRKIEKYVRELGYVPVIAADYDFPRDAYGSVLLNIHDFDILLIHLCRYAIFELSEAAGQYNEVEWAIRFLRKTTWGFCEEGKESAISRLIDDLFKEINESIFYYQDISETRGIIRSKFLAEKNGKIIIETAG